MTDAFIEDFLATFDDSRFPSDFLHHYELMECLSLNEMGETLLVKNRRTGKYYVAKCYSDQSLLSQTNESDLLRQLHHQGLPAYTGEYESEEMRCVVREYAPGTSLDKLVRERPLTKQQSIDIAVQLCEILIYLHGRTPAIIHRDLKPQNIIVDDHGKITLIDFGISRTYDQTAHEDTLCFGTRHYAAPEQYGFSQTDCRSDIYSFGIVLCWLLTGKEDVQQAKKAIPDLWLANIVDKCTAFAPKDRFRNAAQVRDALTGRTARRQVLSFLCIMLIILAAVLYFTNSTNVHNQGPVRVTFKEPLIEQAVRLTLEKDETEEISEQDLLSITELLVFGNKAAANDEIFKVYAGNFANNEGAVLRGSISSLDDLPKLKNLRRVSLCYQNIVDLTPFAELVNLEAVDLRHNPLSDVSPLSQLPSLTSIVLFDTNVSDLTVLGSCPRLSSVDAGYTQIKSMAAFEGLNALRILVMRKAPLQSLERIEAFPMLEQIYLSETQVLDLSPLLDLPRLQFVEVDESMRAAAEAVTEKVRFRIIYQ